MPFDQMLLFFVFASINDNDWSEYFPHDDNIYRSSCNNINGDNKNCNIDNIEKNQIYLFQCIFMNIAERAIYIDNKYAILMISECKFENVSIPTDSGGTIHYSNAGKDYKDSSVVLLKVCALNAQTTKISSNYETGSFGIFYNDAEQGKNIFKECSIYNYQSNRDNTIDMGTKNTFYISNLNLSYCSANNNAALKTYQKTTLLINYTTIYSNENNNNQNYGSIFEINYNTNVTRTNIISNNQNNNAFFIFRFPSQGYTFTISDSIFCNNSIPSNGWILHSYDFIVYIIRCYFDSLKMTRFSLYTSESSTQSFNNNLVYDTKACLLIPIDENAQREEEMIRRWCTCNFNNGVFPRFITRR